jgi:hypothetical protein
LYCFLAVVAIILSGVPCRRNSRPFYIHDFKARQTFANVDQELTNAVIQAFIEDNTLTIVSNEAAADLVLRGNITRIVTGEPYAVGENSDEADLQKMTIDVAVVCERKDINKNLWKKTISHYVLIPIEADISEIESTYLTELIDLLKEDILINTVAAW